MTTLIRPVAASALALGLLAACTGAPSTTPGPVAPQVTIPPLPSLDIPSIDIPSFALPSLEIPSVPPASELEALFPDEVGGNSLSLVSARGEDVIGRFAGNQPDRFRNFISDLGATIDQISAAISFNLWSGASAGEFTGLTITAFRIEGVPATNTLAGLTTWLQEDVDNAQVTTQTVAGKSVTAIVNPDDAESSAYLYAAGDVVFVVGGTPALVEETFTKLP
jgi:hypothetical protein